MSDVKYTISVVDPLQHLFGIQIEFHPKSSEPVNLSLPNWLPGSYMIRDFAKHVLDFTAQDQDGPLVCTPTSKSSYSIKHNDKTITVSYHYYAFDLSVRKAYLDQQYGFINTASSCYQVDSHKDETCLVTIVKPSHYVAQHWVPAVGLTRTKDTELFSWGNYQAKSYIDFTDYPILMGKLDITKFEVEQVPHYMITAGKHFGDLSRVVNDLQPICEFQANVFGGLPSDVDEYLFLTMITDSGFGGLEHLNSTALVCSRYDIIKDSQPMTDGYQTFLSLCSHEYFHTWNVKRLKPKEFIPFDLNREVYTEQLWFYEGMTSYFDDYSLVATNTISPQTYLNTLAKTLTRVRRGDGETRQSVTESSYFSWTKFYQQDHTAPDQITSYYSKGALIACFADLSIRQHSAGQKTLAHLMNEAWQQWGANGVGTTQSGLESLFETYLNKADFETFKGLLYRASRIDLSNMLAEVGIDLNYFSQSKPNQWFIDGASEYNPEQPEFWLGATLALENGLHTVKQVLNNSPAERAGIAVGDQLVAFNQIKLPATDVESWFKKVQRKDGNQIHYFRKDSLMCAHLELKPSPAFVAQLRLKHEDKAKTWLNS